MDCSSDISSEFLRSFGEYSSSGLDTDSPEYETEHPLEKTITAVMSNKLKTNGTLRSVKNVAKIINETPGTEINLPTNCDSLKKAAKMRFKREYVVFCSQCNGLCDGNGWCCVCKTTTKKLKSNFLIYIPIEQQIKYCLDKHFEAIIEYMKRDRNDAITDTDDGSLFKQVCTKNDDSIALSLTLNTDGAQIHNSQKNAVWPVQLYQNYLPPHLRFKSENILLTTIYFGRTKPNTTTLLYPLCKELQILKEEKISFFRSGEIVRCLPLVTCCTLDLPARAMLSGLKLYSGGSACIACLHAGISITDHLGRKYVRYIKQTPPPAQRTHESIINSVGKLSKNRSAKIKSIDGFIEIPPMMLFDGFNLSKGFAVDYMHNALLGVMKLLLDLWMGSHRLCRKSPYFAPIEMNKRTRLNERLLALKPYESFTRKPRSIFDRGFYKAIEYKYLLLFYLPIAFEGLLEATKLKHFNLLSAGIYILLKTQISKEEFNEASKMLDDFADQFERIYGSECVTMNIHVLRHYKCSVYDCGPLWATSMFGFEKNIGVLGKTVNSPTDEIETMSYNYCLWRTDEDDEKMKTTMLRPKSIELPEYFAAVLRTQEISPSVNNQFIVGDAVKCNKLHYKSLNSKGTKSIDHFIEMKDGIIGCVHIYVQYQDKIYLVLEEFVVIATVYHLKKIKPLGIYKAYPFKDIAHKLLYLKFSHAEVVTNEPNYFEN